MEMIYEWMGTIQLAVFLLGGLLLPFWLKSFVWLSFVAVGYVFYLLWRLYESFAPSAEGFEIGYGTVILPYLAVISLIGYLLQKTADHRQQTGSED
ncbi:hypothetical protein [Planococcus sp. ISL-109]|uniref:hypothetical protein n=1 Tax=Planococcus sp. ISL-109 TaxID=2819166 RepID=UPI001BEC1EF6|nr:hypothetical protein [Planococcus sp. ISL-109]MBT2581546.1 hypothetical protein [Planococcus sp. ISL-109]